LIPWKKQNLLEKNFNGRSKKKEKNQTQNQTAMARRRGKKRRPEGGLDGEDEHNVPLADKVRDTTVCVALSKVGLLTRRCFAWWNWRSRTGTASRSL